MTNFAEEGQFGQPTPGRLPGESADSGVAVAVSPEDIRDSLAGKFVCPFCGSINEAEQGVCPRCTMENSPASRKATKSRIGPWYVLQTRNPAAPGMKFETLLNFARKGRVKPRSIVRGPTTHQLWKFAAQVKGLSREFGVCYSCGGTIDSSASLCPQCNRLQDPPANPDVLLETKDAPAPATPQRPSRTKEPDLAEIDAEFVIPALGGTGSEDSVAGVSMTGSMAGVAFDPTAGSRSESSTPPISYGGNTSSGAAPSNRVKKDDGFLSPKDLAAAFKLNFSPSDRSDAAEAAAKPTTAGDRRRMPRPQSGLNSQPLEQRPNPRQRLQHPLDFQPHRPPTEPIDALAAPSFHSGVDESLALPKTAPKAAAPRPRPRHRVLKVATFLVLFGVGLYVAAVFIDPTLRQQSQQVYNRVKSALLEKLNSDKPSSGTTPHSSPSPAPAINSNTADVTDPGASAAPVGPNDVPNPAAAPATSDHGDAQSASASASGSNAASPSPPATRPTTEPAIVVSSPVVLSHGPAPAPAAATVAPASPNKSGPVASAPPSPAPKEVTPPPQPAIPLNAARDSMDLYRQAMSLEGKDPAKAIALYKSIKRFPEEDWPGGLDICIRRCEMRLKDPAH